MLTMTNRQAGTLSDLLARATEGLREHAAQHDYRADAMRAVGERTLARYHASMAERTRADARDLDAARANLRALLAVSRANSSALPQPDPRPAAEPSHGP